MIQAIRLNYHKKFVSQIVKPDNEIDQILEIVNLKHVVLFRGKAWQIMTAKLLEQFWKYICPNITITQQNVDLPRNNSQTEEDFEEGNDLLLRTLLPSIKLQI